MIDDPSSLASRYLDGDVTADERAQVDGDPTLLADVTQLRVVRALLAERDEPVISMRERHLAAAFDAWDRLPAAERTGALRDATPDGVDSAAAAGLASISTPSTSRAGARRRRLQSTTWLGAAAAGLVLVLAAGLVLRPGSSDDDSSSSATADGATEPAAAQAESSASDDDGLRAASELEQATAADVASGAAPTEGDADVSAELGDDAPPPDTGALELLETPDDLAIFASDALDAPSAANLPDNATVITEAPAATERPAAGESTDATDEPVELPLCLGADRIVGLASYDGEAVVVGIDDGRSLALAYRAANCSEVARALLD